VSRDDDIRAAFIHLRRMCDPRGHGLLDVLERLVLQGEVSHQALTETHDALHGVYRCDPDESGGLADVIPIR
jgi:hypothetical protein